MTWHDAPMLGLDLETTGPDPYEAVPVSFALVMFFEPGVAERVRTGLVQPGLPIPPEATAVHGITDEAVAERGGDLFRFTEGVLGYLLDATRDGVPLVGMNLRYDLTVMDQLTRRFMKHGLIELGFETPVLDALVLDRHVDRYRKGRRTLGALADHYGLAPRPEHDPVADVFAARWVVGRIADRNPELRTLDITEVHTIEQAAHYEWATSYNAYRVEHGQEPLGATEYGWPLAEQHAPPRPPPPPEPGDELLVSVGQAASLAMRFQESWGVTDRTERLWLTSQIVGRPVPSGKDLTVGEYRDAAAYLQSADGAGDGPVLLASARDAIAGGWHPPVVSIGLERHSAPPGELLALPAEAEPYEDVDTGEASAATKRTVLRKVMAMRGNEATVVLRRFGQPVSGKANDKKLRLYGFACRGLAQNDEDVMRWFGQCD